MAGMQAFDCTVFTFEVFVNENENAMHKQRDPGKSFSSLLMSANRTLKIAAVIHNKHKKKHFGKQM